MNEHDNIQAVIDVSKEAAGAYVQHIDGEGRFVLMPDGLVVDLDRKRFDDDRSRAALKRPERQQGTYQVEDADSFLSVWGKYYVEESEVWADRAASTITAIFNAYTESDGTAEGGTNWRDHRAVLTLRKTAQWSAWEKISGQPMRQTAAAEFIEDRSLDFVSPDGATMLEVAQSIQAAKGVKFESTKRLATGETTLEYRETTEATAGKRGNLAIPDVVHILLQPYEGGPAYDMEARFRYRISDGDLALILVLTRPEDVLRAAFSEVVDKIGAGIGGTPVVYGLP